MLGARVPEELVHPFISRLKHLFYSTHLVTAPNEHGPDSKSADVAVTAAAAAATITNVT